MEYLSLAVKKTMKNYNDTLKKISKSIKIIGGTGRIHGCIVDIDGLNHIYLNPYDGKISYYYATSMVDKHVYNSLENLLLHHNEKLLENLKKEKLNENCLNIILTNNKMQNINISKFVSDTFMYSPSRRILTMQYLTELNVIKFWNDEIIDKLKRNSELSEIEYENKI